jgi:protein-S-isoprenylcysteine O-methyltransferase Ste14
VVSEKVERIGNFLFRWRSYIPWFLVVFFWKALISPEDIKEKFGIFWEYIFEIFCISISLIGIIVRVIIAGKVPEGTSGRNTKEQKAESLNTTGLYSIVRHPIYVLGNFPIFLGIILFLQLWWTIIPSIVIFWIYYLPIMKAEDKFLEKKFKEEWRRWAERTPLAIPNIKNYQPFNSKFSWKKAIKKEYTTLFVILSIFSLIDTIREIVAYKKLNLFWLSILITISIFYLTIKYLKKKKKI